MTTERTACSVNQFCESHSVSRSLFYRMLSEGWGPAIMKVGRKTLVSAEAAQEWRERMETQGRARR